ncbi:MAG: acid phosphatase [Methylovulum sp.]|uniref:acid phosphatase n=1 Tax=Methylovulum sp. TaxID=1916980 RepID=UPI0026189184|nr:acid phosphatase [Methylovulum sp.]MDD2724446.1 acid phosphatase [Methylovulum sp.]MDD5123675.1 acid phosphatase [Methylovulum sp.]
MINKQIQYFANALIFFVGWVASASVLAGSKKTEPHVAIGHIVIIYAENRSFDNLYGLFPGADGIKQAAPEQYAQIDHDGKVLKELPPIWASKKTPLIAAKLPNQPFQIDAPPVNLPASVKTRDLVHRYYQNIGQINGGLNNRFAAISDAGGLVMGYYDGSKLPLWQWAKDYVLADHFFMGAFGGSYLNHQWLVCACTPQDLKAPSELRAQLDPQGRLKRKPESKPSAMQAAPVFFDGAFTPDGYTVNTVQPPYQPSGIPPDKGGDLRFAGTERYQLPPQTTKTIGDTLSDKKISWAWYAGGWNKALADGVQTADKKRGVIYSDIQGTLNFQAHHQPFNYYARFAPGSKDRETHLKDGEDFLQAINNGTLPQVSFYKPTGDLNEHPGYTDVLSGDRHIAELLDRLSHSKQWPDMVVIVTYDENGGFWDHAAPPKGDRWGPGTRIPTLIISPFAKRGFVDHTVYDTTSILKFITRRYGLEALPGVRGNVGDLMGAFEFK